MSAAIYYFYYNWDNVPVWGHRNLPILQSIASVRHWSKDIPIRVLDVSNADWSDYPTFLNFEVHKSNFAFDRIAVDLCGNHKWTSPHLLSKPLNALRCSEQFPEDTCYVLDSDIFFIKPPDFSAFPDKSKLQVGPNTSFWAYNQRSDTAIEAIELWSAFCSLSLSDPGFNAKVKKTTGYKLTQEESIIHYLLERFPNQFESPRGLYTHAVALTPCVLEVTPFNNIVGLHAWNRCLKDYPHQRDMVCVLISEVRKVVEPVLGSARMSQIYGNDVSQNTISLTDFERLFPLCLNYKKQ